MDSQGRQCTPGPSNTTQPALTTVFKDKDISETGSIDSPLYNQGPNVIRRPQLNSKISDKNDIVIEYSITAVE